MFPVNLAKFLRTLFFHKSPPMATSVVIIDIRFEYLTHLFIDAHILGS